MKNATSMTDDNANERGHKFLGLLSQIGWRDRVWIALVAAFTLLFTLRAPV